MDIKCTVVPTGLSFKLLQLCVFYNIMTKADTYYTLFV